MGHPARADVWRLHAERLTVRQIAERLGLSKSTVQRILDAGRDRLAEAEAERVGQLGGNARFAAEVMDWLRSAERP